jgi:protein-S-isoprenylcysteine O-methyltransferase Ste14
MPESQSPAAWYIDAAWVVWVLVWLALSLRVKKTVRREDVLSRTLHLGPLLLAGLLLFDREFALGMLAVPVATRAAWMAPAGAAIVTAGLVCAAWARLAIGANWSGTVTVKQEHVLIDTGPYALARHPIYTGLLTALAGTAIERDNWAGVLALVLVTAAFLRKMRTEERFMTDTFGDRYLAYKRRTKALVPYVW